MNYRVLRKKMRMTQQEEAALLGTTQAYIAILESKKRESTLLKAKVLRLAYHKGVLEKDEYFNALDELF